MSTSAEKRKQALAVQREIFKINPVAVGCTLLMMATGAFAQQTPAQLETVQVTGIRKGIEDAISVKKNNDSIVEAISAEDIGKLPDASVAESISRLPGVTAQRNKSTGKASSISVRGMSPDFNGALLNGREQASSGDSRGVEFDLYPSELLGSVVIYKTPDGALVGQGLASTIDLQTVRPLNFGKRTVAVNYRKQRTGVASGAGEGDGDRTSLSYVDQFADRTIGVALGFVRFDEKGADQQKFNSWGGWTPDNWVVSGAAGSPMRTLGNCDPKDTSKPLDALCNSTKYKVQGGFTADTETSTNKRDGAMATFQFKPNKDFESTLDFFYSKGSFGLKKTGLEGAIGGDTNGAYDPAGVITNYTLANGVVTAGTLSNYKGVVRNHVEGGADKMQSFGWNNKFKLGDWQATADISRSKVTRDSSRYETTAGQAGDNKNLGSISWTGFDGGNFTDVKYSTGLSYADRAVAKLTDVNGWSGGVSSPQAGYVALPHVEDKVDAIRLAAKTDLSFGPLVAGEFGANFTKRDKLRSTQEGRLVVKGGNPYGVADVPGGATSVAGTTGLQVVSWDPRGSLGGIYELGQKVDADILNKDWTVKEEVNTFYFKGDLEGELAGFKYRGNVGAQYVHTDQSSTGFNVDRAKCVGNTPETCPGATVGKGRTYSDFLPSLNVSFDLGSEQYLRMAAAKVLSRANMGDMRASLGYSINSSGGKQLLTGSGGNPDLEPFRAKALDVSYEKYFGNKGYVSVAGFYKKLDSYILRVPTVFDFKPYIGSGVVLPPGVSTVGLINQPINGQGGNIKGIELSVNIPLSMASSWLDGFGVMINHSSTSSSVELPTEGFSVENVSAIKIPLPGLSKKVTNLRFYYEKNGFQIAVAQRKRSDFLGEVSDFQDNRQLTFIKGESIVDLQVSYEFQTGWLKGLSLLAQGNNMTNALFQRYNTSPSEITDKIKYGKTYLFGANYKF
ncbi:TonB-dependent receptor [Paucibacter sp. DJ2R-2]|uniref:TonB-dependent receptor n=1 Tax=Paucibacter sp. DJ2R-2 TaxID=2893558 RepID=UPI0021E3F875|nr:TonB-dependent receptor [Paucibacter sp. DJ2R-2]MCV2420891.1 TonB-dependent receptor [Paucibacter sp. DJ4R-1]MCV2440090.1 TonB-dependent receptor [Paucibacter sp. DJ2R-2]